MGAIVNQVVGEMAARRGQELLQTRFFGPFAIAVLTESRNCLGLKSIFPRGNA